MTRFIQLVVALLLCAAFVHAQNPPAAATARVRSHVERFSTPEARAERSEADATAKLKTHPDDTESLNQRALARMRVGRYQEAYDDLRRAVSLKADNAAYQANFGFVLWKLGRVEEAVTAERAALKLQEANFTAHYQLGRFLLRIGGKDRLTEAVTHLRRALELDPQAYDVRFELIAAFRAQGDTAQASSQVDFLTDARPADPRVFYVTALLAADRNDLQAALKDFKEALRRDPTLVGAWQDMGLAYIKLQRWRSEERRVGKECRSRWSPYH